MIKRGGRGANFIVCPGRKIFWLRLCSKDFAHLAQTGVWILVSLGEYLRTHLKDHTRCDRGPDIHGEPRRVSLRFGEAQLAGCLRV